MMNVLIRVVLDLFNVINLSSKHKIAVTILRLFVEKLGSLPSGLKLSCLSSVLKSNTQLFSGRGSV